MISSRMLVLLAMLILSGCGIPFSVVTAGLGFGTAVVVFDTDLLLYLETHPM